MLPPVKTVLAGSSPVTAVLGSGSTMRLYRHGAAPDRKPDDPTPYVTWFLASGTPENQISGLPSVDRMTIQVDCWARGDAEVVTLATAVRDAIEPFAHCTGIPINERETETRMRRIGLQFDWFVDRDEPASE